MDYLQGANQSVLRRRQQPREHNVQLRDPQRRQVPHSPAPQCHEGKLLVRNSK